MLPGPRAVRGGRRRHGERELTTGPEPYPQVRSVTWSPDGSSIAFVQDMGDARHGAPQRGVLRIVDVDGSDLRTLMGPGGTAAAATG